MSRVRRISLVPMPFVLFCLFLLAGCGGGDSSSSDFGPAAARTEAVSGIHPPEWLPSSHAPEAKADILVCADCHGNDFAGGTTGIACTKCHLGNEESKHPLVWGNFAYALHGDYVKLNGADGCANISCHGTSLEGVPGVAPSCVKCHLGGTDSAHPVEWKANIELHKNYVGLNGSSSCRTSVCHGPDLKGVFLSGPSCGTCHPWAF